MDTRIVYCDETGDDGITSASSNTFTLTSLYMSADSWQDNYDAVKQLRKQLKEEYGFHLNQEMHTKHFLTDKNPYRDYKWTSEQKIDILKKFTIAIASLDIKIINVIIDKDKIITGNYNILETALTYNIQRIENDSNGNWNYLIITDEGRISPMRKTARAIRTFNPIQSQFGGYINKPIHYLIEDILEKNSKESFFIQICDFVSYFVHLYYKTRYKKESIPNRAQKLIDYKFIGDVMATLKNGNVLNTKASSNIHGLVIYPK